jgi:hypothetical protein
MGKANMYNVIAKKDLVNGQVKKGDSFTVFSDNPKEPGHADVQKALKDKGVDFGFFNKPGAYKSDWLITKMS